MTSLLLDLTMARVITRTERERNCVSRGDVFWGVAGEETVCCHLHGAMSNHGRHGDFIIYRCSELGCGNAAALLSPTGA